MGKNAPPEAVDFLEYITNADNQLTWAEAGSGIPVNPDAATGLGPELVPVAEGLGASTFLQLYLDQFFPAEVGTAINDQVALLFAGQATPEEAAVLRMDPEKLKEYRFKRGRGCLHCRQTGYVGRIGIFEVLPMSDKVRALVTAQAGSMELFKAGREEGMRTLREAAIEKVFRGITTTTEMVRVTGK